MIHAGTSDITLTYSTSRVKDRLVCCFLFHNSPSHNNPHAHTHAHPILPTCSPQPSAFSSTNKHWPHSGLILGYTLAPIGSRIPEKNPESSIQMGKKHLVGFIMLIYNVTFIITLQLELLTSILFCYLHLFLCHLFDI